MGYRTPNTSLAGLDEDDADDDTIVRFILLHEAEIWILKQKSKNKLSHK